jgi:alkylated DNA repair dioxygenase AlkB
MLNYLNITPKWKTIIKEDEEGDVKIMENYYNKSEADEIYTHLHKQIKPTEHYIKINNKEIKLPRLQCSFGDDGMSYKYSGASQKSLEWSESGICNDIREKIEKEFNTKFNYVLVNYYRDGNNYIGAHSDADKDMIDNYIIVSLSFGATRKMVFKHKKKKFEKKEIYLTHGTIVIMGKDTQKNWTHEIVKNEKMEEDRWNLTFRQFK